MDGFAGYRFATVAELPEAIAVMDPFHVMQLAGEKVTACRQRLQQATTGHRGRKDDPLYKVRKTLLTRRGLLTERQHLKVPNLWDHHDVHVGLQVTYMVYQDIIDAYAHPKRSVGKRLMRKVMKRSVKDYPQGWKNSLNSGARCGANASRCRRSSTTAALPTAPSRPSTARWSTYAASP